MKSKDLKLGCLLVAIASVLTSTACHGARADQAAEAPPPTKVTPDVDITLFAVDHPEQFPLAAAVKRPATSELVVTGSVTPDITRNVPVVSLASGRITAIHARLGDPVKKGQLLMTIRSDDVSGGYSNYRMAVADEILARTQYERSKDLYEHGAIALNDLQVAQDTEDKAKIAVDTAAEHLRLLGNDPDKPVFMVDIFAPTAGIITDQQVTTGSLVQAYNTPYPFTISDLSSTWVVCDVYENDLANVRLGDTADITLNAYPDRKFNGFVKEIASSSGNAGATGSGSTAQASGTSTDEVTNFVVKIRVADRDVQLKPGMSATADIETQTVKDAIAVPIQSVTVREEGGATTEEVQQRLEKEAADKSGNALTVQSEKDDARRNREQLQRVVFIKAGDKVRMQKVESGIADNTWIEVKSGVKPGDEVVSGTYAEISRKLKDGMAVRIEKPKKPADQN